MTVLMINMEIKARQKSHPTEGRLLPTAHPVTLIDEMFGVFYRYIG